LLKKSERGKAFGLSLIAVPLSSVVGAPICSFLIASFGWKVMVLSLSGVGIVWAIIWSLFFNDTPKHSAYVSLQEKKEIEASHTKLDKKDVRKSIFKLFFEPTLFVNNIAYFAFGFMLFFGTLWLPGYLLKSFGLDLKSVGWYLTIPWLVAAVFLHYGGVLSDNIYKKTQSLRYSRSYIIFISQALATIAFLLLAFFSSIQSVILLLSLGLGFGMMANSCFYNINIDLAKEKSGLAQGISSTWLSIAGILAPSITGYLVETSGSFKSAFILLFVISSLAVIAVMFFHQPDKKNTQ
jgi:nitrate/nitrite transporter NarK